MNEQSNSTIVTYSSLSCFNACRRKYHLRYIDGIVPKVKSASLEFGSMTHAILELYFRKILEFQETSSEPYSEQEMAELLLRQISMISIEPIERAKLTGLIVGYVKRWYEFDINNYNVHTIESEFRMPPFGFCKIELSGKIDGIVQRKEDGAYYILEHKTASIVDDTYKEQKQVDSQTMLYAHCAERKYGIKIAGAIHDILIKQKIRQKTKESENEFCDRLIADVTDENFVRIQIDFDDDDLKEFSSELEENLETFESCVEFCDKSKFYKSTCACIGRYGACEYLPICRSKSLPDNFDELFERRRPHEELTDIVSV